MDKSNEIKQFKQAINYFKYLILDKLPSICWVAGGSCRDYFSLGYAKSDIDIYFPNSSELEKAKKWFLDNKGEIKFENNRLIVFHYEKYKFELIKIYFSSPEETIEQFDFTVCCCAVDKVKIYYHDTFFIDLAKKRLVINKLLFPLSTLQRLQKYIIKGYLICNGGLLEIAKAIQLLNLNEPKQNHLEFYPDGTPKFVRFD